MEFSIRRAGKRTARCMHCFSLSHRLLQEASHNVPTNSFLLNVGHNASQSASSGTRIHPPPVHTKIEGFNTYATYVPMIPRLLMCPTRQCTAQNAVAAAPLKELLVLPYLKELSLSPVCHPGTSHLGNCPI